MRLKRDAKGLTELRCFLHEKGGAEVTATSTKKPGQWEVVGSNSRRNLTTKPEPLVTVLVARFSQQMRMWPESPEEAEFATNDHAKDAKMFTVPCGCKASAVTTAHFQGNMEEAGEEEAPSSLDLVFVLGFPRKAEEKDRE